MKKYSCIILSIILTVFLSVGNVHAQRMSHGGFKGGGGHHKAGNRSHSINGGAVRSSARPKSSNFKK